MVAQMRSPAFYHSGIFTACILVAIVFLSSKGEENKLLTVHLSLSVLGHDMLACESQDQTLQPPVHSFRALATASLEDQSW